MTQQREKRAYRERLIASLQNIKVNRMAVLQVAQKRHHRVDRYQEQDSDDVSLLVGFEVVCRVQEDKGKADDGRYTAKDRREEEAEMVECVAMPQRLLNDVLVCEGGIAEGHVLRLITAATSVVFGRLCPRLCPPAGTAAAGERGVVWESVALANV
jgi:hypothetical protein